jgi:hypothetical protein
MAKLDYVELGGVQYQRWALPDQVDRNDVSKGADFSTSPTAA